MKTQNIFLSGVLYLLFFASLVPYGCTSTNQGTTATPRAERVYTTLIDRMRDEPGLTIIGTGNNATIRIRGNSSLVGDNEPLFVVNGSPVGSGFSSISSTVDVNNIKSIKVLSRAQSGLYGSRGGNGVVVITLK